MDCFKLIAILFLVIVKMNKTNFMYICKNNHIIKKRDILYHEFFLWKLPIKYQIKNELKNSAIKEAIRDIENKTCIKFNETDLSRNKTQGMVFQKSYTCASHIGAASPYHSHIIELSDYCSKSRGIVLHEIGHALGLLHEHTRSDRDNYVNINVNNIANGGYHNFRLKNDSDFKNFSTYYDYHSIMHYEPYDFAYFFWRKVLTSKLHDEYDKSMGQREYMTFNDYKRINLAYCDKCNFSKEIIMKKENIKDNRKKNENTTHCRNSGYPHYNNCSECICPFGYTGPICKKIIESDKNCGNTSFNATEKLFTHYLSGIKKCYILLKAKNKKKINVGIYDSYSRSKQICTEDVSHQIKFLKDKGMTGLLLCSYRRTIINVTSETSSVLIYYNGQDSNHFLQFGFKQVN